MMSASASALHTREEQVPASVWVTGFVLTTLLSTCITVWLFGLPWYQPLVAVLLALVVAVLAMRALGQTDLNPVSGVGKLSQVGEGVGVRVGVGVYTFLPASQLSCPAAKAFL